MTVKNKVVNVKGGKKRGMAHGLVRYDVLRRIVDFRNWSLKQRFLYVTGLLLLIGSAFQIFFLSLTLEQSIRQTASERLSLLTKVLDREFRHEYDVLRTQVMALAAMPRLVSALLDGDKDTLRDVLIPYVDDLRLNADQKSVEITVASANGTVLLQTDNIYLSGRDISSDPLVLKAGQQLRTALGMYLGTDGPRLMATLPIVRRDTVAGFIGMSITLERAMEDLAFPSDCKATLYVLDGGSERANTPLGQTKIGDKVILGRGVLDEATLQQVLLPRTMPERVGEVFFTHVPLRDALSKPLGGVLISFDTTLPHQHKGSRDYELGGLFLAGAVILWVFLYLNVTRIETFFRRLKKIIIASHANDFTERFQSDHVHCLDVLNCHNEKCPVFKDPARVCYLETGSEAISPKWRDTCIFLGKYDTCPNCPVYTMRKGDELSEMRNVVNTMMRLWSTFLSRTGHLLAYVLRSQEQSGQLPSLDQVSNRLEQMAKLTFFSHDVQGSLERTEVYEQLSYAFATSFDLKRFLFFEVDHDANQIVLSLDRTDNDPLCKRQVFLSADVCRANRVAEDVYSFYNPVLCPHFNCDHNKEARVCMPMVMSGHVGAVFSFLLPQNDWERIREVLPIIRKYLDEAAPVLSSLRLLQASKEQSLRDPLTQCLNRRFLDEFISKYEPLSEREGKKAGFLMADVDYFKQVNDEYGHEAGDAVLQQVVGIIKSSIRRSDLLIRYGGEEFLILLQEVKNDAAEAVAEKIRANVEKHPFELPHGQKIHKTISLGVAEYPEDANTLYKAIKFSDVALYEAKNHGRNKVMRFKREMWTGEAY